MTGIDAVVLAGSVNNGKLKELSNESYEALVEIARRPMVSYVVDTLRQFRLIKRIAISGPNEEMYKLFGSVENIIIAPAGRTPIESCLNALEKLNPSGNVLVTTSDIPLLTRKSLADFIKQCSQKQADVYYPVVPKEVNERLYPGVKRTYIKFKEGTFTGGNLFMVNPQVVKDCAGKAESFVEKRKSPLALARLVGWSFLLKFIMRSLTLKEAEAKLSNIFGIKGAVIISPYPEVGIDVDKPGDLLLVREKLAKKAQL